MGHGAVRRPRRRRHARIEHRRGLTRTAGAHQDLVSHGLYRGREHVSAYFAGLVDANDDGEYYREPDLDDDHVRAVLLTAPSLPTGATLQEEREACRALKGSMLRQEVYADDAGPTPTAAQNLQIATPHTVTDQSFTVKPVQPLGATATLSSSPTRARPSATTTNATLQTRGCSIR